MPFQLQFNGGPTLELNSAQLIREMGSPVRWKFSADLGHEGFGGEQVQKVARLVLGGPAKVRAVWDGAVICPEAKVVGISRPGQLEPELVDWHGYVGQLDVYGETTGPTASGSNAFLPRRRVHKFANMADLAAKFENIAEPIQRVKTELRELKFPDGDKASIIQDGVSDWVFFGHILDQCRLLAGDVSWLPLTLVGGVGAATAGKWMVTPGAKAAYVQWNDVNDRIDQFQEEDGEERFLFSRIEGTARVPTFPSAAYPSAGVCRPWREFESGRWTTWRTKDLPRFSPQGDLIWRIQDEISRSDQDDVGWKTFLFAAPPETNIIGPQPSLRLAPWIGTGEVEQTSKQEPWIQVKLTGFERGEDVTEVRLSTPFSGTDGKKGLHYVPEKKTKVEVCWPGRFDTSVVLLGNTRWDGSDFASPSIYLEATQTAQYEDIHVKRVGDVIIDSSLSTAIKQQTTVTSQQQLKIHADGADLKMNGGTVYTGRGF